MTGQQAPGACWPVMVLCLFIEYRLGLNLHQHMGVNQAADFNHGGGGTNLAEEFAVSFANLLPVINIDDVYAGAHHILHAGTCSLQGRLDIFEYLHRLCIGFADADNLPIGVGRSCSRDVNGVTYTDST